MAKADQQMVSTAACVIARNADGTDNYLYRGAPVPASVPKEEINRLLKLGVIGAAPKAAPAPSGGDGGGSGGAGNERPNKSANAAEWKTYAIAKGIPQETVNAATRDQLVERFYEDKLLPGETGDPDKSGS
ncbi:hypothetical protein [Serinicoccus sediminis]|uniref:hypothetical protein n=1 Tax=Serinicoccus sediminis TaxID=2306021 RepID=UPI001020B384|nr:hypothetical protein [Serinicoccus sediminis]